MAVLLDAVAVAYAKCLDQQTVAYLDVALALAIAQRRAPALYEPEIGEQSSTIVFVAEIRPDDVVEDVVFKGLYCVGKAC
jgi:hypothetical protein